MKDDKLIELINSNIISFNELLLENYNKIGLKEKEVVLIIKLHNSLSKGINRLDLKLYEKTMTLQEKELSEIVCDLVYRDYINIEISSLNGQEVFSLDGTIKKLIDSLNDVRVVDGDKETVRIIKKIEEESGRDVSQTDLEIVQKWFYEYKYSVDQIDEALNISISNKKVAVRYIDRILANKTKKEEKKVDSDFKDLFQKIYGK